MALHGCSDHSTGLLSDSGDDQPPRASAVAELAQVDSLPCTQIEVAASHGQCQGRADDYRLGVRWHVVGPLVGMQIVRGIFRNESVEYLAQVVAYIRVGILVKRQGRRRMFYLYIHDATVWQPLYMTQ